MLCIKYAFGVDRTNKPKRHYFMQISSDFRIKLRGTTNESGWNIDNGSTFESPSKNIVFCSHNEPPILHRMILVGVWYFWLFFWSNRHLFWARFTHSINSEKCTLFIALNKHFHKMIFACRTQIWIHSIWSAFFI